MYPTGGGGAVGGYGAGTVVKAQHLKANFSITVTPILAATIPRSDFFIIIFFLMKKKTTTCRICKSEAAKRDDASASGGNTLWMRLLSTCRLDRCFYPPHTPSL